MKRADKRTPTQIAVARLTNLINLPDRDLCQTDHRTSALAAPHKPCGHQELGIDFGMPATAVVTVTCQEPGRWGYQVAGVGVRRGCDRHAANACRARLWLARRRLQLNPNGDKK